jgi:hypothetical protein
MKLATLIASAVLSLIISYDAHATTLEQQTSAASEYLGLKYPEAKGGWFLIGQTVSPDGKDAVGFPAYKLFKDEQDCKTELLVIKDDPPPTLKGRVLSCHPLGGRRELSCHHIGEHEVSCHQSATDVDRVHVAANEQTGFL